MFPPAFGPRMGYLCKYMKQAGWEPVVITEYIEDKTFEFLSKDIEAEYVKFFHAHNPLIRNLEWLKVFILDILFDYKDKRIFAEAEKKIKNGSFDGILCSTYRTFPLPAAHMLAKKHNLPLIADHRDIIEQYAGNEFLSKKIKLFPWLDKQIISFLKDRLLRKRNNILPEADFITTVSPWHVEQLKKYNPNVELIYNGYDPELFFPAPRKTAKFIMSYTGRLLSMKIRDPKLLFEALEELHKQNEISPKDFKIEWFVDKESEQLIRNIIKNPELEAYMEFCGYVPASKIPEILNQSSIAIQLANKATDDGPKGIMTTKIFEALATERPLLCVRSDESFLEQTIKQTNSGVAARTKEEVVDFIRHYYNMWKEKGYTTVDVNRDRIESFSRKKQASQFMALFESTKKK